MVDFIIAYFIYYRTGFVCIFIVFKGEAVCPIVSCYTPGFDEAG